MKRSFVAALLGLAVSASAVGAPSEGGSAPRTTTKPTAQFASCFVKAEERAAQPWSYVPKENGGGTFSNLGAKGAAAPYFVRVADRGATREIRLEAATDASVVRAVDACI